MKNIFSIVIFIFVSFNFYAQQEPKAYDEPKPIIGWDSLRVLIEIPENYPEICRRADIIRSFSAILEIDSTGTLIKIRNSDFEEEVKDSIVINYFIPALEKALKPIKWYPRIEKYIPVNDNVLLKFNFYLLDIKEKGFNILAPREYIYFDQK